MRREDNTYRMPTLPTPTGEQVYVNKEVIDAIKGVWNQIRSVRQEIKELREEVERLRRK